MTADPATMYADAESHGSRCIGACERPGGMLPLVSIICVTYNHEQYLKQCLDGFLMQETSFPVEIIVHDDASNDGTKEILQSYTTKYPGLFHLILQEENQLSRNIRPTPTAIAKAKGRYLAFCDGDDYWTDRTKLERQVHHLEDRPDSQLCFHRVKLVAVDGKYLDISTFPDYDLKEHYGVEEIIRCNFVPTSSVVVRRDAVASTPDWFSHMLMNDWPRWVLACENGPAEAIDEIMGVYRVHHAGLWQGATQETRLMANLDFYCVMSIFASQKIRSIATSEKQKLIAQLKHYAESYPKLLSSQSNLEHLTNHVVLGRILRLWKTLINPSLPI